MPRIKKSHGIFRNLIIWNTMLDIKWVWKNAKKRYKEFNASSSFCSKSKILSKDWLKAIFEVKYIINMWYTVWVKSLSYFQLDGTGHI